MANETRFSVVVKRANTGELSVEVVPGEVLRDSFTRVSSGLTLEKAQEISGELLRDFAEHGKHWQQYQNGERAIPAVEDGKYIKKLAEYVADPEQNQRKLIEVLETPEILRKSGIKADKITISPGVINKCLADTATEKIPHPHNLGTLILSQLPSQLRNPAIIMQSKERGDSLVAVTMLSDKQNLPVIVSLANGKNGKLEVCGISSAYGKGKFENWLKEHIDQNKIIAYNKEKTNVMSHSSHLLLTNHEKSISGGAGLGATNISFLKPIISQEKSNVNPQIEKISRKFLPNGDKVVENASYRNFTDKSYVRTNNKTIEKLAERLHKSNIKFSAVIRSNGISTLTVAAKDYALAKQLASEINPDYAPQKLSFNEILNRFTNVKSTQDGQHMANCPCCKDSKRHLYIKHDEQTGKVLLDCKKGCTSSEVVFAAGLKMSDLFTNQRTDSAYGFSSKSPTPTRSSVKSTPKVESPIVEWKNYVYTDKNGAKLYQKSVAYREDGDKFAAWKRYDANGKFIKGLDGAKPPLFEQHNLKHDKIYIVEGEKDVKTMENLGFPAVCSPHGSNWDNGFAPQFAGKEVVVITDNDEPGRKYGEAIRENLTDVAKSVSVIPAESLMQGLKEGGDITDIAESTCWQTAKLLLEKAERCERSPPEICPMDGVSMDDIDIEFDENSDVGNYIEKEIEEHEILD